MNTKTDTGTWTKFDDLWMVRVPVGAVPPVDADSDAWHFDVVVVKKDGTEKTVSVCRTPEFLRDGISIHAQSTNGWVAKRHQAAIKHFDRRS